MQRIFSMMVKEFKQVFRNRPMLSIIFIAPILQLFILAFAITTEVLHIKLLVCDLDRSQVSKEVVRGFGNTDRFDLLGFSTDLKEIKEKMKAWEAQMALVIPPGFSRDLGRGQNPEIQVVVDGVDGNTAGVALGYARGILGEFGTNYVKNRPNYTQPVGIHLVNMEERMWYNPDLSSQQFMVPGIVVVLLTILPMMLSALSLVKEKEVGTLEQLMVTPLTRYQLLLGKLIPFLILSYVELAVVMTVAIVFFKIPMNGSYLLLAGLAFLYLFTTLGLGIFISTITSSQQQAMFTAWFFMVFMILMGGFFIPIENMPPILQKLTYLNPMRYFIYIIRDIFQKDSSLFSLLKDAVPMTAFGLLIFSLSVLKFQKRVG